MSIESRIETLEKRMEPGNEYPIHMYIVRNGANGHTRENCPTCASMTEQEYTKYKQWCSRQPVDRVTCVVVVYSPLGSESI